ncbi:MAG: sigma-70 family RNA polymerase sigma factor [Pseudomonadota bacterium]
MTLQSNLLDDFRQGDASAFAQLVQAEGGRVRAVVARYFNNLFDQEEALQEIWLRVYEQRLTLDPDRYDKTGGWLRTIAHRRCIDLLRRRRDIPVDQIDEVALRDRAEQLEPSPEHLAEQTQLLSAVQEFTSRLKPQWQRFFTLHFVEGLDYEEIASRLSISRLRCRYMKRVLIGRARRHRALLEALGRGAESEGDRAS